MPIYKCPKCGRQVELPEGKYYCKVCGPSAVMVKLPKEVECRQHADRQIELYEAWVRPLTPEERERVWKVHYEDCMKRNPGDYVTVKNVHGTFVVGEYATTSYSGVIDYLRLYGVPDDIIEEYYPKIKTLRHGEALKIPKHHSNPQTYGAKLSLSGLCHTLTLDEYDVLYDLDYFYRLYPSQYVSLIWLARKYQDRHEEKYGRRTYVLKECIDEVRRILEKLWRKGMVQPEAITVKTYDRVVLVRPKTKEEALKAEERWRITLAGHDCVNPPEPVVECIKAEIEREERETGKVTPMKAFCECWKKYETQT
jgi:hypothetical protein